MFVVVVGEKNIYRRSTTTIRASPQRRDGVVKHITRLLSVSRVIEDTLRVVLRYY